MKYFFLCLILIISCSVATAQHNPKPCTSAEAGQFDFWLGSWDLYSADTLTGTNVIYKVMDGCAVQENFESKSPGFSGKSWSMYNPQLKLWQQTWIDNQGAFIYLTGSFENGTMTLKTAARKLPNGKEMINRMTYHHIDGDSFDWDWDSTTDNGSTWKSGWHIHYKRK